MNRLIIFVKQPVPGNVKTRLTPEMTADHAAELYAAMIKDAVEVHAGEADYSVVLYCDPPESVEYFRNKYGSSVEYRIQNGDDLGTRMHNAIQEMLDDNGEKVIVIGSDCPGITVRDIQDTFEKLESCEVVIGPSDDGGYYLIGMRKACDKIFDTISWSTDAVFEQTVEVMKRMNIAFSEVIRKYDVDTYSDVLRLSHDLKSGRIIAKHTREAVESIIEVAEDISE